MRVLNERKIGIAELPADGRGPGGTDRASSKQGTINRNTGRRGLHEDDRAGGKSAAEIVKEENLAQTSDAGALEAIVDQVLAANAKIVEDYRGGKKAAFGRLMGESMKASGGKANPQVVKDLLTKKLEG